MTSRSLPHLMIICERIRGTLLNFEEIAKELYRVTKQGGVVVWVVGDETKQFCESLSSFKQAIYFVETVGFNLLDTMIYYKQNYAPAYPTFASVRKSI